MKNILLTEENLVDEAPDDFIYIGKPQIIYELKILHDITLIDVDINRVYCTPNSYVVNNENEVTHLNLSCNYLSSTKGLEPFIHLLFLDLSKNNLVTIEGLQDLTHLKELNLSCNYISNIQELSVMKDLKFLNLSNNCITEIEDLDALVNLEILDLCCNNITKIDKTSNLFKLKSFYIDEDIYIDAGKQKKIKKRKKSSDIIQISRSLKAIDVSNIEEPDAFIYINKPQIIVRLKDAYNITLIEVNEDEVYHTSNSYVVNDKQEVTHLNLSYNHINEIKDLDLFVDLIYLDLSCNDLLNISGLDLLIQLQTLNLSNNHITKIEKLDKLVQLRKLYLSNLGISKIEGLEYLTKLQVLDLSYNDISQLDGLKDQISLEELYIYNNNIKNIEELNKISAIVTKKTFRILQLNDNAFLYEKNPPFYLERQSNHLDIILKYFSDTGKRVDFIKMALPVKVMLLGNHSSGKTTFYHYLEEHKIPEISLQSTHILNIHEYPKIIRYNLSSGLPKAIIFDFGGQDYYHGVYQAFFSEDSINLIFWYLQANINNVRIANDNTLNCTRNFTRDYWLYQIKYAIKKRKEQLGAVNDSTEPIFLVETHADLNKCQHNYAADFSDLNIKKEYCISLDKNTVDESHKYRRELDRLIEDLLMEIDEKSSSVDKLDYYEDFLSYILSYKEEGWIRVKEDIYDKGHYKRNKINNETDNLILAFLKVDLYELHNKGLVLYYKGNEKLDDIVWLNPTKTVEFIYNKILTKNIIINNKGIIDEGEFDEICNDEKMHELLLSEKIVFHDIHSHVYIIPGYLQLTSEDIHYFKLNRDFMSVDPNFVIKFCNFIPFGLINQLICLYGNFPNQKLFWRDEVNFEFEHYTICIRLLFSQLSISVYIKPILGEPSKLSLKEVERAIFLNIIDLYYAKEVLYDYENNFNFADNVRNYILLKERKEKFDSPHDMYISVDGNLFVNHSDLENIRVYQEFIPAYDLIEKMCICNNEEVINVINRDCKKVARVSLYKNFSNNKMVKKMKKNIYILFP